ncbi:hypothetical protein PPYR_06499 [Photinus pyralis]|uniref:Uncharacterized protein n=1 Tax=Photinus pyralis TaxID=7054 RepID=A0A5N4AU69_PHOPY|nr:uncharacterized protein LOC116167399 [Photinus pyralis]XP_031345613.1 uncharacterized protein LOC116172522 [Photinus pyralis]KAB0800760.1 hypothetical protein PPYR_06499 [Photinus pyralis]
MQLIMKLFFLYLSLFGVHTKKLTPEVIKVWEGVVAPYFDDCVKMTNVDPEIPRTMFELEDLPTAESFACYMKCIFEKMSFFNSNNELDQDQMLKSIYMLKPGELQRCMAESANQTNVCKKTHDISACIIHRVEND